jgi:hypothetical protein
LHDPYCPHGKSLAKLASALDTINKAAAHAADLISAVARFREDRERMLKRIEFASQPIGNCGYCLVGNKPGEHHLEDCPAYRAPVVKP